MKAFPTTNWQSMAPLGTGYDEGMDLRDYFAAKAMQAMLASPELMVVVTASEVLGDEWRVRCANMSYKYADAMMEIRKNETN